MISLAAFLAEIALESVGSWRASRYTRTHLTLWAFLTYACVYDILTIGLYLKHDPGYAWASWFDYMGHWLFLCVLGCQVCGKLMNESRRIAWEALFICSLAGITSALAWSHNAALKDQLLNGAAAADSMLVLLLALAWICRQREIDTQWFWIGAGIFTQIAWDLVCSLGWTYWDGARHVLPIGEIAALLMFNYAVRAELPHVSLPLGKRIEEVAE